MNFPRVVGFVFYYFIFTHSVSIGDDELQNELIKTRDKLSDLQDRFESCKEELIDYHSMDGTRDMAFEELQEHWMKCIGSLEEYKRRENEKDEEIDKIKSEAKAAKELFLERESEMALRIKALEADGTICEVDESVVEEKYEKEFEKLKKSKERAEANSAELFEKLQEMLQAQSKAYDMYKEEEDKAFDLSQENLQLKDKIRHMEYKMTDCQSLHGNIRDCTEEMNKVKHELQKKEKLMETCGKSNNDCVKSRSNLLYDKTRWENQEAEYQKQVKELKEQLVQAKAGAGTGRQGLPEAVPSEIAQGQIQIVETLAAELQTCRMKSDTLKNNNEFLEAKNEKLNEKLEKTKAEVEAAKAQSGGIRFEKGQEEIVKKIADELMSCRIQADALQTENGKLEAVNENLKGKLEEAKTTQPEIKIDQGQIQGLKKIVDDLDACKKEVKELSESGPTHPAMKIDETQIQGLKKFIDDLNVCKKEVEALKEENGQFEKDYIKRTYDMREQLGNELVGVKIDMNKHKREKELLEKEKETFTERINKCESEVFELQESKEKLEEDRKSLLTVMKTKDEENLAVVRALMEKKAAETESTVTGMNQATIDAQMKLNSCQFNLQIKQHELDSANAISKSISEKLHECEGGKEVDEEKPRPNPISHRPTDTRNPRVGTGGEAGRPKPAPTFLQAENPVEVCSKKLSTIEHELGDLKAEKQEVDVELLECRGALSECGPELEQLRMMNSGYKMILDQTEPKYKAEIADLKNHLQQCDSHLAVADRDASKYMKSFGASAAILMAILVTSGVQYGMRRYESYLEGARVAKRQEREARKLKKSGRKG